METAATLLKQARTAAGVSTRALARAAGSVQPRVSEIERGVSDPRVETLERLLQAVGYQLALLPTRAPTASAVAESIRDHISTTGPGADERSFRALLVLSDGLTTATDPIKVALTVTPPAPTGDTRFDAAIAGIVEHHLAPADLPEPEWVHQPTRYLDEPWTPDPYAGDDIAVEAPAALRRHGVLLAADELASV